MFKHFFRNGIRSLERAQLLNRPNKDIHRIVNLPQTVSLNHQLLLKLTQRRDL